MTGFVGTQIRYADAVVEALRSEMHRDPAITFLAVTQGPVVEGLSQSFGNGRLALSSAVGAPLVLAALGAADQGLRPVCAFGPGEGSSTALEELAELGAAHASGGGDCPLTVCLEWGEPLAGGGAAAVDPLAFLIGAPGLKLIEPATPADAKGLLVSAVRDDEVVCVLQHAALVDAVGTVPEGAYEVDIGRARLSREGERLTIVAHGVGVAPAERAVDDAELDADLIDLRTLQPLDCGAVLTSVCKTGRCLFVESAVGGERVTTALLREIWEHAFEYLDAPLARAQVSGSADEDSDSIVRACDDLLAY